MDPKSVLHEYIRLMLELKGQDLILKVGVTPRVRIGNAVKALELPNVAAEVTQYLADQCLNPAQKEGFEKNKSVDFAFALHEGGQRFRTNLFYQQGSISAVIRNLWRSIPSLDELKLPPILKQVSLSKCGIILIGGVVASGKTTTINAMIETMNQSLGRHILTIEDPIEYLHSDYQSVINQREVGQDAVDFQSAMKYVVRQSPDVIVIGEMRDAETFQFAVSSAEVGRLVIGTVHARSVTQIFDRITGFFDIDQRDAVLNSLYPNIACFAVQQLLMSSDGVSLVPAVEIMLGNYTTRQLVKERKFDKLTQALRNANQEGMMTMDQSLLELWRAGKITKETAFSASERPEELEIQMKGISLESSGGKILGA